MVASSADLLRLLAVPVLGWAAWRDVQTRRVPNVAWYPLVGLGGLLLLWELPGHLPIADFTDRMFLVRTALSLGFVIPLVYLFWRFGAFGGADAKAFMSLAVLFPTYPRYDLATLPIPLEPVVAVIETTYLPVLRAPLGVFSMTILSNTVLVGLLFPVGLAVRNLLAGEVSTVMFLSRRVDVARLPQKHGRLFESPAGFTRNGLDLDALRMYLRWRGTTLGELRRDPSFHRDPDSVEETHPVGDGAVDPDTDFLGPDLSVADRPAQTPAERADVSYDDPWGAEAFLEQIEGSAYGTTPEKLRDGLAVVTSNDEVWISPGMPFIVPMFFGLLVSLTVGDTLYWILTTVGVV